MSITDLDLLNPRALAAILLGVVALAVLAYASRNKGKGAVFALIVLAGAGTLGYFEYSYQHTQQQVSVAVQQITNNPQLTVHCERLTESLTASAGSPQRYRDGHPNSIYVPVETCNELLPWVKSDHATATTAQATAIHDTAALVATYTGSADVCVAISAMTPFATALGADQVAARTLATDYYVNVWQKTPGNSGCSIV